MINRDELMDVADQLGLRPQVVEKDYVLGWVLAGIARDPVLHAKWVFKGGTCLKKCYFETYRFSEDLDFTIQDPAHLDQDFLLARFGELSEWLYDETGIELPKDKLSFKVWDTKRGSRSGEGKLSYRGPIAPNTGDLPRIKLDLTADERLVLTPAVRGVVHPYSDLPADGITAQCYDYPEIFGEKVRALSERTRPRDLYDVINLFRNKDALVAPEALRDVITKKCDFKSIPFPTLTAIYPHKEEMFADWANMLAHQLPQLPPAESFWDVLDEFFEWLQGKIEYKSLPTYPSTEEAEVVRQPAGSIHIPGRSTSFMEVIRFAASNRLLVELDYTDKQGRTSTRLIEPYSLRRTRDGNLLLMSINVEKNESRSYRVDQIRGARMVNRVFKPRFEIELTPTAPSSIPTLSRPSSFRPSSSGFSATPRRATRSASFFKPQKLTYTYSCPYCGKKFHRTKQDSDISGHKDKSGYPCGGRTGMYEGVEYK